MTSQNTVLYTPFAGGRTVRDIVEHTPALVSEAWCREILQHILQSLEQQYASNAPHRIITPDTVAVLESGEALLLPSPDGLASAEADSADDIHALALVIHYAVSAEFPPEGPLGPRLYDHYSDQLTQTIDRCLGPNLRLRPKSIPELRAMLELEAGAPAQVAPVDEGIKAKADVPHADAAPAVVPAAVPAAAAPAHETPQVVHLETPPAMPPEPIQAQQQAAEPLPPAAASAPPTPAPAPDTRPAQPIAATPLKPSSHSAPVAPAPAAAPARPKANAQPLPSRKKSGVERWAMIAGAAIVLLAAGSALYAHLNQDSSDDLVAVSTPQQEAAQGLDAGEAMVAPPAEAVASDTAAAAPDGTPAADAGAAAAVDATGATAGTAAVPAATPASNGTLPAARHADTVGVVNGTTYKLLIKPWGTVYVNGVDRGVSPPVKRLTLDQGQHTIRIVNPNFTEHVMTVNAGGAESATIEHDFTAQAEGGR